MPGHVAVVRSVRVGGLRVLGASLESVGELAARHALTLHELSAQRASLEEAYLKLTDDAVDYRAANR